MGSPRTLVLFPLVISSHREFTWKYFWRTKIECWTLSNTELLMKMCAQSESYVQKKQSIKEINSNGTHSCAHKIARVCNIHCVFSCPIFWAAF